jgi:hypothetical protein
MFRKDGRAISMASSFTPSSEIARDIVVAAGLLSSDESTPGIYLRRATASAAERLRPIWLLPTG